MLTRCKALSTLSPKTATVAVLCHIRRFRRQIVAEIGDYSRQCGQALKTVSTVVLCVVLFS